MIIGVSIIKGRVNPNGGGLIVPAHFSDGYLFLIKIKVLECSNFLNFFMESGVCGLRITKYFL